MCLCYIVNLEIVDFIKWQEKTPTEMIGVIDFLANPCKWVHIGVKWEKILATRKRTLIIISNT